MKNHLKTIVAFMLFIIVLFLYAVLCYHYQTVMMYFSSIVVLVLFYMALYKFINN